VKTVCTQYATPLMDRSGSLCMYMLLVTANRAKWSGGTWVESATSPSQIALC